MPGCGREHASWRQFPGHPGGPIRVACDGMGGVLRGTGPRDARREVFLGSKAAGRHAARASFHTIPQFFHAGVLNYSVNYTHPLYEPNGALSKLDLESPCYNSTKGAVGGRGGSRLGVACTGKARRQPRADMPRHTCHAPAPCADFLMPSMRSPRAYERSPLFGAPAKPRKRLAMFSGLIMVCGGGGGLRRGDGGEE